MAGPVRHPLPWRDRAALAVAVLGGWLSRATGRGAGRTLPGRVALALRPGILTALGTGRRVLLVSGTNGKTTTTRFLRTAMETQGPVVSNSDGANLAAGLVSALLDDRSAATAVLEVDEVVLPVALEQLAPAVVVLLNLSRDQLDRVQEVSHHVRRWGAALASAPATHVVANADDPLVVAAVRSARADDAQVTWVAAGSPWRSDAALCPRCGAVWSWTVDNWRCRTCGLEPPDAPWGLEADLSLRCPSRPALATALGLSGRASAANVALAVAAAAAMGIAPDVALEQCRHIREVEGRYLRVDVGGRGVQLILAKNPAGWLEVISEVAAQSSALLLGINARTADGTDPSWLWDVPFERLRGRDVVVFGDRALDLSARLYYAGVEHAVVSDTAAGLHRLDGAEVTIAANYTAFQRARAVVLTSAAGPAESSTRSTAA